MIMELWPLTGAAPLITDDFPFHARQIVRDQGSQGAQRSFGFGTPCSISGTPTIMANSRDLPV
jgi:hypothetical protein